MLRPNRWIVGCLTLGLVLGLAIRPDAGSEDRRISFPLQLASNVPLHLRGCATVDARLEFERGDCLQSTRLDLIEGYITFPQAIRRLEACAGDRADLVELVERATRIRLDAYRARLAFGHELSTTDQVEYENLRLAAQDLRGPPSPDAIERLLAAGITPDGFATGRQTAIIGRLRTDARLRRDFRLAFGDVQADALDAILSPDTPSATAVILGQTVIVPNRPLTLIEAAGGSDTAPGLDPVAVSLDEYAARVTNGLTGTEGARSRFFARSARENHRTGSIGAFAASLRHFREEDTEGIELRSQVEREAAGLLDRLDDLDRRLGLDPLLLRSAQESVALAGEISRGCEAIAQKRRQWIHTGAGVATGLVGAAGVVVVSGSTGTLLGGVTIAAALEATVGAYLIARSERITASRFAMRDRPPALQDTPERQARRPNGSFELADGRSGLGGGEHQDWFDDYGELREWLGLGGDGIDEESGESTEALPRENTIPPVLPEIPEDELRELPPILDTPLLHLLRELTLPEIQERLDEFLARRDPATFADFAEEVVPLSPRQMIDEAQAALDLWVAERLLAERFGVFFVQAEIERAPANRRSDVLLRAMGRYMYDREFYSGSRDVEDLRRRVASRLVAHCRTGSTAGDLILRACTDESALAILMVAAFRDSGTPLPEGSTLGIQAFDTRLDAVVYDARRNQVHSLTRGTSIDGVVAPIYHAPIYYYTFLLAHAVVPEIDVDEHLLLVLPDRPMPPELEADECAARRGLVGRAVDWLGSMVGVRRLASGDPCRPRDASQVANSTRGGERSAGLSIPSPPNPLRSGGGQSGGGAGGGGGGSGQPMAGAASEPGGSSSSGESASGSESGGGESGTGTQAGSATDAARDQGSEGQGGQSSDAQASAAGDGAGQGGEGANSEGDMAASAQATAASDGSEAEGGYNLGASGPVSTGPNLSELGREAGRLAREYERAPSLRVQPWRLRSDEGMLTGSDVRVLYADNARALQRFDEDDLFITLAPAEVEAQRRMLEADTFPVFSANVDCGAQDLPPRRVFRRAAAGESGFRYVYCDHDESMVIFRDRNDANSYSGLAPPDRPLFLARLGAERLARFERTVEIARLRDFLRDPNVIRQFSKEEIYAMAKVAGDLLVFQNALESALVQSMNELGPSVVRSHYYEMHRQVLQAPLFISMAEGVYRLNQRLASDPLQSLAWANAQPRLARQGFFDLYHTLGGMMAWPDRWATLEQRYGDGGTPPPPTDRGVLSLDFLQILSDPIRVQIDWSAERSGSPSIRDRQMQEGVERTPEERDTPTLADRVEREDETEHQRGGTGGLGLAGEGDSLGPEQGRRPLQMIRIRIVRDDGEPDRPRVPDDNLVHPGGTEGEKRSQTEESASRQEAILWVSPQTFIDAVLSPWDTEVPSPATAGRIPPILRFSERLREIFLRDMHSLGIYDNRLRTAMGVFSRTEWLRYAEAREAMGGPVVSVRAVDTGRFSGAYSGNPPINDQDQIRIPNFFTSSGVLIPADLFPAVREHYTSSLLGIFDLASSQRVPDAALLRSLAVPAGQDDDARAALLWSLELIRDQARTSN